MNNNNVCQYRPVKHIRRIVIMKESLESFSDALFILLASSNSLPFECKESARRGGKVLR